MKLVLLVYAISEDMASYSNLSHRRGKELCHSGGDEWYGCQSQSELDQSESGPVTSYIIYQATVYPVKLADTVKAPDRICLKLSLDDAETSKIQAGPKTNDNIIKA